MTGSSIRLWRVCFRFLFVLDHFEFRISHFSETYVCGYPQAYLGSYQKPMIQLGFFAKYSCFFFAKFEKIGLKILLAFRIQPAIRRSKLTIEALEQRCEICSKLTIKPTKRRQWHISHLCSSISIVNFEQVNVGWEDLIENLDTDNFEMYLI